MLQKNSILNMTVVVVVVVNSVILIHTFFQIPAISSDNLITMQLKSKLSNVQCFFLPISSVCAHVQWSNIRKAAMEEKKSVSVKFEIIIDYSTDLFVCVLLNFIFVSYARMHNVEHIKYIHKTHKMHIILPITFSHIKCIQSTHSFI